MLRYTATAIEMLSRLTALNSTRMSDQKKALALPRDVVVGTPGRILQVALSTFC